MEKRQWCRKSKTLKSSRVVCPWFWNSLSDTFLRPFFQFYLFEDVQISLHFLNIVTDMEFEYMLLDQSWWLNRGPHSVDPHRDKKLSTIFFFRILNKYRYHKIWAVTDFVAPSSKEVRVDNAYHRNNRLAVHPRRSCGMNWGHKMNDVTYNFYPATHEWDPRKEKVYTDDKTLWAHVG